MPSWLLSLGWCHCVCRSSNKLKKEKKKEKKKKVPNEHTKQCLSPSLALGPLPGGRISGGKRPCLGVGGSGGSGWPALVLGGCEVVLAVVVECSSNKLKGND